MAVKDTKADGDEVHTRYDRRYNTGYRMNNEGGSGSSTYSALDTANKPDRCGPDDRPGDGR